MEKTEVLVNTELAPLSFRDSIDRFNALQNPVEKIFRAPELLG